jgi:spermidine synthase
MDNLLGFVLGAGLVCAIQMGYKLYGKTWGAGSSRAYIHDSEKPEGPYRIVRKFKTATQKIALVEHLGETWVYCNGEVMFSTTEDEDQYAETLVHIPMSAAARTRDVLIIGGGGGVTTREALKYKDVESITTVDIDEVVMEFGKSLDGFVKFNKGSLSDPRVKTVIADGRHYVENSSQKWDVIIIDVPEPTDRCPGLSKLFSKEFYELLRTHLNPGGAIGVACSASSWMPDYFGSIQATIMRAGFHTLPYHLDFIVDSGEDWGFCLGTLQPIETKDIKVRVPTTHLTPERLQDALLMPFYFANLHERGQVQTDSNEVLLNIVREVI